MNSVKYVAFYKIYFSKCSIAKICYHIYKIRVCMIVHLLCQTILNDGHTMCIYVVQQPCKVSYFHNIMKKFIASFLNICLILPHSHPKKYLSISLTQCTCIEVERMFMYTIISFILPRMLHTLINFQHSIGLLPLVNTIFRRREQILKCYVTSNCLDLK